MANGSPLTLHPGQRAVSVDGDGDLSRMRGGARRRGLRDVGRGAAGQLWKVVPSALSSRGPACCASIITAGKGQTDKRERQGDRENERR